MCCENVNNEACRYEGFFDSSTLGSHVACHLQGRHLFDVFYISWPLFHVVARDNDRRVCPQLWPEHSRSAQASLVVMPGGTGGL